MGILKVENIFWWKVICSEGLAGITCEYWQVLILTMYLKAFENIKYFRKVFKYK